MLWTVLMSGCIFQMISVSGLTMVKTCFAPDVHVAVAPQYELFPAMLYRKRTLFRLSLKRQLLILDASLSACSKSIDIPASQLWYWHCWCQP